MGDNDIRESLNASKEWKKDLKAFANLKETLDIDMVTTTLEADVDKAFQEAYKDMIDLVTKKIDDLVLADKNLGMCRCNQCR